MTIRFLIGEGFSSVRRVPGASVIGALLTAVSLAIVGGFVLILLGYRAELDQARASAVVEVFLNDSVSTEHVARLEESISAMPSTLQAHVRTPEEGAKLFGDAISLDTAITGGTIPLPTTIRVELVETSRTSEHVEEIRSAIEQLGGIDDVAFASDLLKTVENRFHLFTRIALVIGGLLTLCVVGIVAVTAQLTVVTRRSMIRTMRLLGAERRWIIAPFVLQGFLIGLVGGGIAALALWFGLQSIPELLSGIDRTWMLPGLGGVALFGSFLGLLGSAVASGYTIARVREG